MDNREKINKEDIEKFASANQSYTTMNKWSCWKDTQNNEKRKEEKKQKYRKDKIAFASVIMKEIPIEKLSHDSIIFI